MYLYFAPMEGVTGADFRRVHRAMFPEADRCFAPFIAPDAGGNFKKSHLRALLPDLNRYLRLGYFGCDVEKGCFFYRFHFLIDGLNRSTLQKTFIGSFSLCTSAAARGKEILQPLIKGETTIEELLEYDNTIFQ